MTERYSYSESLQVGILTLMVRDQNFLTLYRDVLKHEYFSQPYLMFMADVITSYKDKFLALPTKDVLLSYINTNVAYKIDVNVLAQMVAVTDTIFNTDLDAGMEYVRDQVILFGKRQAMKVAIQESIPLLDEPEKFNTILQSVKSALLVGEGHLHKGIDVYSSLQHIDQVLKGDTVYNEKYKVPVGFLTIDANTGGGIGMGEAVTVIGGSGQGKSMLGINMTIAAANLGKKVFYISTELKEADVMLRYGARLSQCLLSDVLKQTPEYTKKISLVASKMNFVRVKFFSPLSITMTSIYSYISQVCGIEGIEPGLIVLDNLDEILPYKHTDNLFIDAGSVYSAAMNLIYDFKCPGIFIVNTNRTGYYTEDTGAETVGQSWARVYKSDMSIVINQTRAEALKKILRLKIDKCRRGRSQYVVPCMVDYATCTICENPALIGQQQVAA